MARTGRTTQSAQQAAKAHAAVHFAYVAAGYSAAQALRLTVRFILAGGTLTKSARVAR